MGIRCYITPVDEDLINELLANPDSVYDFLGWERESEAGVVTVPGTEDNAAETYSHKALHESHSTLRRVFKSVFDFFGGKSPPAVRAPETFLRSEPETSLSLDKSWHGIHFLLTGSAWEGEEPWCYLIKGGKELIAQDLDHDPPRVLRPNQVADWADALSSISIDDLRQSFDPEAMMKQDHPGFANIYPGIWDRAPEEDDTLGYLLSYYDDLRSFLKRMKSANKGVIIERC